MSQHRQKFILTLACFIRYSDRLPQLPCNSGELCEHLHDSFIFPVKCPSFGMRDNPIGSDGAPLNGEWDEQHLHETWLVQECREQTVCQIHQLSSILIDTGPTWAGVA